MINQTDYAAIRDGMAKTNKELAAIEAGLERLQHRRARAIALSLVGLGLFLFISGRAVEALGDLALGEYLSSLVTEIGGAFLIFWLLDTVWRNRIERHQNLHARITSLKYRQAKWGQIVSLTETIEQASKKKPIEMAEVAVLLVDYTVYRLLREDLDTESDVLDAEDKQRETKQKSSLLSRIRSLLR